MLRRLFIPDLHSPHHDSVAYNLMLDYAQDFKPDEIVILGDWFDCYSVSRFDKSPERMVLALEDELAVGIDLIQALMTRLKPKHLYFVEGNHENRITRYVKAHAPLIHKIIPPLHELFELPRKSSFIPYGEFLELGNLSICHGIKVGRQSTTQMLDMLSKDVLYGHTHRLQQSTKRLYGGKTVSAYSCGWLGRYDEVDYAAHPDWAHGFGVGVWKGLNHSIFLHEIKERKLLTLERLYEPRRKPSKR